MLCIILQALNVLRQLRREFCTIVLHLLLGAGTASSSYGIGTSGGSGSGPGFWSGTCLRIVI